jgi:imidazolonepropionase-like amidohydrolase
MGPDTVNRAVALPLLALLAVITGAPAADAATYHFVNGQIISMASDASMAEPLELVVEGERIVAVGTDLDPPREAIRIDLEGGYLMPGLAEMHAHVPAPGQGDTYRDEVLFLYLANGITTIRGMLGDPTHLKLRDDLARHDVLGPRLITSGPSFNGNSVSSPEQARRMVEEQVKAGYDFLKVHPGLTRDEYDAMAEAASSRGIPFAGHVPADVGLLHALASGQATIDHLDGYVQALVPNLGPDRSGLFAIGLTSRADTDLIGSVVAATVEARAAVVPTETLLENFSATDPESVTGRPQNAYLPRALYENYERRLTGAGSGLSRAAATRFLDLRKSLIKALNDGGVLMLLGSDAPQIFNVPGFSAHRELAAMTAAGLTPWQALAMGTRNPAVYFEQADEFGTLETGKAADLIWLAADPLTDIGNTTTIQGVMVRGRWLDRATLDQGLAEIAERHAR